MHNTTRSTVAVLLAATAAGYLGQRQSFARPQYAADEGVSCAYCHFNPAGGGKHNYRGNYYRRNTKTFAGFDDYAMAVNNGATETVAPSEEKPKTWTGPAQVTEAHTKVIAAQAAHEKAPADAALKKSYADSLSALAAAVLDAKSIKAKPRFAYALKVSTDALAMDATNASAMASKKSAEDGMAAEAAKEKAAAEGAPKAP